MKIQRVFAGLVWLLLAGPVIAAQTAAGMMPYDAGANAAADLAAAQAQSRSRDRLLMVMFGANWCPDCRAFDAALRESGVTQMVDENFVITKVDVGNWDRNLDIVEAWGDPIAGGIPAIVVATPDGEVVYTSKAGDLARARSMDQATLIEFFQRVLQTGATARRSEGDQIEENVQ
jgi:thioredoxin 1